MFCLLHVTFGNCLFHQIMRKNSTRKFFGQFVRTPWIRCVYITSKYHPLFHPWPLTYIWPWISNMTLTFFIVTSISIYLLIKSVLGVWCSTFCVFKVYKYMYKSTVQLKEGLTTFHYRDVEMFVKLEKSMSQTHMILDDSTYLWTDRINLLF